MNEFDDIITSNTGNSSMPDRSENTQEFDAGKWAAQKQQSRKTAYNMIDSTAQAISCDSRKFRSYLDVQSRFDRYSVNNALLITAQMPTALQLRDYDAWKDAGTPVKKKQKGIIILEPGDKYTRDDGTTGVSLNVKRVFDVSQTSSKDHPVMTRLDDRALLKALVHNSPVVITPADKFDMENTNAFYDPAKHQILVRKGMDAPEIFKAVTKELAHAAFALEAEEYSRRKENFKAQCVSYILCNRYGIDTQEMEIRVPVSLSGITSQEIQGQLSAIRGAANDISARMAKSLEQHKSPKSRDYER